MTPEQEAKRNYAISKRLDYLFWEAWRSIATDRGYRVDTFLGTSSHGTLAIRGYLFANGV